MNHDECAHAADLAPAAALGALDADEQAFVRAHLAACPRPHPEMRESAVAAAVMGAAMPEEHVPSPDLRYRLLAAARAEPALGI